MTDTLHTLLERLYGVKIVPQISAPGFQVGVVVGQLLKQNANRIFVIVVNLSPNTISTSPDGVPSATHGITLGPGGGSLIMNFRDDLDLVGLEWAAIATAAGSDVLVVEGLISPG